MKALVYTAPHCLELQDLPCPSLKANEVLVRIRAVGICGSDVFGYMGKSKRRVPPLVLGHEFSGEIAELGDGVSQFRVGDPVAVYPLMTCGQCRYCTSGRHHICPSRKIYSLDFHGAMAEYIAAPAANLFRLPAGMGFQHGALIEPLANAIHVVEKCGVIAGQTGVIFGAGSIGLLIYWVARNRGATRLAIVDLNPHRLSVLEKMGADLVIDASKQNPVDAIRTWTQGQGADFTIDAVGNTACRQNAIASTAPGGISTWIGLDEDVSELSGMAIVNREIEIKGSYAYSRDDFAQAIRDLEHGNLPIDQFVRQVPFDQGGAIFEELASGKTEIIKAIFTL